MTDTPLDLDALRTRADRRKSGRDVSPDVENLINDLLEVTEALVDALRAARAQVAAVLAVCDKREASTPFRPIDFFGHEFPVIVTVEQVRAAVAAAGTVEG